MQDHPDDLADLLDMDVDRGEPLDRNRDLAPSSGAFRALTPQNMQFHHPIAYDRAIPLDQIFP